MFKTLTSMLFITSMILFSLIADVAGVYIMISSAINHTSDFMTGFTLFSLGTIMFLCVSIAYLITKANNSLELIAGALADFIDHSLDKEAAEATGGFKVPTHPLLDLLKGKFPGGSFGQTTINVSSIDEEGNISPMMTKTFDNPEDFFKHRDEIIAQAFGTQPKDVKKQIDEMTIEELQEKEKEAAAAQKFELAAAFRDAINRKKNPEK